MNIKNLGVIKLKLQKAGLILAVMTLIAIIPLSGCSGRADSERVSMNLYTDGDTDVADTWKILISDFHEKNPNIDIKVQTVGNGQGIQKLAAAQKAGQKSIDMDLLETGSAGVSQIFQELGNDGLETLSSDSIANLKDVTVKTSLDNKAVPFRGTTVMLAYNSDTVKTPPKTMDELYSWIKAHPGRFAYNDPSSGGSGQSFVVTAIYNQLPTEALSSIDQKWEAQWDKGFALLKELNPYMYKASGKVQYPKGNNGTIALLGDGQVDMIPVWADQFLDSKSQGLLPESAKITQLDPAFNGDIQTLVVPALSQHKDAASKFINYVISAEGQATLVHNMHAIPVIDNSKLPKETLDALSGLNVSAYRPAGIGNLENDLEKRWFKVSTI
jgi:putative spermidine/putrescine transport system substrate-binding protein